MPTDRRRRQLLGASLGLATLAGPAASRAAAEDARDDSGATRRWRHYVPSRYGQVHVFATAPAAARGAARRPPVVCLHPSPTSGEMYADLATVLASDRSVFCPDTPGYGASDPPPRKPTIADYGGALADAIAALLAEQRPRGGRIDLFGFHTGSLCALEVALQRPDLVRRLVLSGVPHYGDPAERERERRANVTGYPYFADRDYVGRMYQRLVLDAKDSGDPATRLRRFGDRLRAGPDGWWGPDAVFTYDSAAALPRLRVPTLLIAFNEQMTGPTRAAAALVPGARLVEMLDLPIFGFIVAPQRVGAALREFFDAP